MKKQDRFKMVPVANTNCDKKIKRTEKSVLKMNIRKGILSILLLGLSFLGFTQQDPMYTQYMNNPLSINPAFAGTRNVSSLTGVFRRQWTGIDGAPLTTAISYNNKSEKNKFGYGGSIIYDALGPVMQTGLYLDYAYPIKINEKSTISLGLKGGFNYFYINYQGLIINEADDDLSSIMNEALFLPNFGIGAYYYTKDLYIGLSVPKLLRNSLEKTGDVVKHLNREEWHVFLMAGYILDITENIDFKPSVMTQYSLGAPLSIDINATVMLYDKIWLGIMYRFGDAIGGNIRWQVNHRFHIGYSYDLTRSELNMFNNGTHEVFIGYDFGPEEIVKAARRFF